MPELPDIVTYIEALEKRALGHTLEQVRISGPFLLRTAVPLIADAAGKKVTQVRRIGKRIAIGIEGDLWLVLHLMIAGRLHWHENKSKAAKGRSLAIFDFDNGSLTLTEAGSQRRASLHFLAGEESLQALDPGGAEISELSRQLFGEILQSANHTLKRALTDPRCSVGSGMLIRMRFSSRRDSRHWR